MSRYDKPALSVPSRAWDHQAAADQQRREWMDEETGTEERWEECPECNKEWAFFRMYWANHAWQFTNGSMCKWCRIAAVAPDDYGVSHPKTKMTTEWSPTQTEYWPIGSEDSEK